MTEAQWLACDDPVAMLAFVLGEPVHEEGCEQYPDAFYGTRYPRCRVSDRKLRLFAVACCRRLWARLKDERSRRAVEVAELYADGMASESQRQVADQDAADAFTGDSRASLFSLSANANLVIACWEVAGEAARNTLLNCSTAGYDYSFKFWTYRRRREEARRTHLGLLRDIFGNPFRPVSFPSLWGTDTVLAVTRAMYETRDFSPMPILADALMDAGCDNPDVLDHCRGPGPHARGCWVVDLVLGKK
jgi:hypothetical protein